MTFKEKCLSCKKNYKDLKKRFPNTYKFCHGRINNFCLMLRKGVYPYEYKGS